MKNLSEKNPIKKGMVIFLASERKIMLIGNRTVCCGVQPGFFCESICEDGKAATCVIERSVRTLRHGWVEVEKEDLAKKNFFNFPAKSQKLSAEESALYDKFAKLFA